MVRQEQHDSIRNLLAEQEDSCASKLWQRGRLMFGSRLWFGAAVVVSLFTGHAHAAAMESEAPAVGAGSGSSVVSVEPSSIIDRWRDLIEWLYIFLGTAESASTGVDNQNMILCMDRYYQNGVPQGLSPEEIQETQQNIQQLFDLTNQRNDLDPLIKGDFMDMLQAALVDLGG